MPGFLFEAVDSPRKAAITSLVIPGRRAAPSPESITALAHGLLRLPSRERQIRNALSRRDERHRSSRVRDKSKVVAGFTKRYAVDKLVWFEIYDDPTSAISREKELKKWRRNWKIRLIEESNPQWIDLYPQIST
jgi:putative endonuclease